MFKSELFPLEKLIGEVVQDEKATDSLDRSNWLEAKQEAIANLCESLKNKWLQKFFSSVKEPAMSRYIQYHQAGIVMLSNVLSQKLTAGPEDQSLLFYRIVISHLEGLLEFLRTSFSRFFDHDQLVSAAFFHKESQQLLALTDSAEGVLRASGIDEQLIIAIKQTMTSQQRDARHFGISHRLLDYDRSILSRLLNVTTSTTTAQLAEELYRWNFNSFYFIQWYQQHLLALIGKAPQKQREAATDGLISGLGRLFVAKNRWFDGELPATDIQLLSWLQLRPSPNHPFLIKEPILFNEFERMPLNLSAVQFALLIRLCYLEGCFHLTNISQIIRFFTSHYTTKKQLQLSLKSFARAFYRSDQATAAMVRDLLQRMISLLNKTYFP